MTFEEHEEVLEELIKRLVKHPGFFSIKEKYYSRKGQEFTLRGEYDVMKLSKNSQGTIYRTYYEVKGRDSEVAYNRALKQFKRHAHYNPEGNWRYVYVTGTKVKRVRL